MRGGRGFSLLQNAVEGCCAQAGWGRTPLPGGGGGGGAVLSSRHCQDLGRESITATRVSTRPGAAPGSEAPAAQVIPEDARWLVPWRPCAAVPWNPQTLGGLGLPARFFIQR